MPTKDQLEKLIQDLRGRNFREKESKSLLTSIQKEQIDALTPVLSDMGKTIADSTSAQIKEFANNTIKEVVKDTTSQVKEMVAGIKIGVPQVNVPDVHVPEIKIPKITVPKPEVTVNVPPIKIPDLKWPKEDMPIKGWVGLMGVDLDNPLPVQIRDSKGKPVDLSGNTTVLGGSSGKADYFTIKGFQQSAFSELMNADGEIKVAGTFTSGAVASTFVIPGNRDGEIYNSDNPLPVVFGANATQAVNVVDSTGVAYTTSNPLPVAITSGGTATSASNIVDSSGVAYSGSNPIPVVFGASATSAVNIVDSSGVVYGGDNPLNVDGTVVVSGVTNSVQSALIDSSGIQYSGSNPVPVTGTVVVSSITNTTVTNIVDSGGIVYSGSNPLPVNLVSQTLGSSASVLIDSTGVAWTGSNPIPTTPQRALESVGLDVMTVRQVSGASSSVNVLGGTIVVSSITASTGATLLDSTGIAWTGSNPIPTTPQRALESVGLDVMTVRQVSGASHSVNVLGGTITAVTGITNSVAAVLVDGTGVAWTGSNPVPISDAGGSVTVDGSITANLGTIADVATQTTLAAINAKLVTGTDIGDVTINNASGGSAVNIQDGGNTITVDGTVAVSGITNSVAAVLVDGTGVAWTGSNPIPVVFGSGGTSGVNVVDSSGVAYTTSNPLPVTITSGGSATSAVNIVDSTGIAYGGDNPLNVDGTVAVSGVTASVGASILGSDGLAFGTTTPFPVTWISGAGGGATQVTNIVDSGGVVYSGSNPLPVNLVSQTLGSSSSVLVDSTGVQYSGSNPIPMTWVSGAGSGATQVTNIVDSTGVVYSGSNPLPVTWVVTGTLASTIAVGPVVQDAVDDGSAPVQMGGIARTALPAVVANNDVVKATFDDVGRQLTRPVSVRDATVTAYASFATGTEATLLAGASGFYQDLIYILASNNSTAAVGIDIRAGTAGSIVMHLEIPANGTVGVATPVPIPGPSLTDGTGNAWTVDLPDITGTTVYVSGLFTKEI